MGILLILICFGFLFALFFPAPSDKYNTAFIRLVSRQYKFKVNVDKQMEAVLSHPKTFKVRIWLIYIFGFLAYVLALFGLFWVTSDVIYLAKSEKTTAQVISFSTPGNHKNPNYERGCTVKYSFVLPSGAEIENISDCYDLNARVSNVKIQYIPENPEKSRLYRPITKGSLMWPFFLFAIFFLHKRKNQYSAILKKNDDKYI